MVEKFKMKWKIGYYSHSVEKDIQRLEQSIKASYFAITDRMLEEGPDFGLLYTKAMGKGLFEVRARGPGIGRGFFCTFSENTIMVFTFL